MKLLMSSKKQKPQNSILYLVFSIKYFLLKFSPVFKYKIEGHSMSPTFQDQQKILVNRLVYLFKKPQIGDIIAAKIDGKIFIKRINRIKKEQYFLSGDNPNDSFDSKKFGSILKKQIIGKVIYT